MFHDIILTFKKIFFFKNQVINCSSNFIVNNSFSEVNLGRAKANTIPLSLTSLHVIYKHSHTLAYLIVAPSCKWKHCSTAVKLRINPLTVSGPLACCSRFHSSTYTRCTASPCYWNPCTHRHDTSEPVLISPHSNLNDRVACVWSEYLRQCVIDVFCSTSTDRSRKSSSLLLTWGVKMKVTINIFHNPVLKSSLWTLQICWTIQP